MNLPLTNDPSPGEGRLVQFEGRVQLFTSNMPESSFVDFSDSGCHPVFACCWIDGARGKVARVHFPACGPGVFRVELPFRDQDPRKLKVQISMRMQDEGSHNRRTVPLCTSCACMTTMLQGGVDEFRVVDTNIVGNYSVVSMQILNLAAFADKPLTLRASALEKIPVFNAMLRQVGKDIANNVKLNQTVFPEGTKQMEDGLSSREFAGRVSLSSGEVEMENLMTHYAIMNAQEECVKRPLPLAVVMYYLYLKVVHSGKTISDVLSMEDEEFGQFVGEGLQGTCSAGLFPYEQDFEPGLCLSFFHGITLTAVPTEDMVRHLHVFCVTPADTFLGFQGWALSMGQLDGRTTRDLRPIKVNANMTMSDLQALFRQDPLPRGSVRALNPETGFTPVGRCADGVLPELYRSTSTDDCESSSLNARQAKHALIKEIEDSAGITDPRARAARLRDLCKGWRIFNAFTDQSWTCMRQLVDRTGDLLLGGHLRVMTGVGMATNASLEDIKASRADFCGHCFNVGYLKTPKMEQGKAFLLEGTSAMYSLRVTKSSPKATVHLSDPETGQVVETKTLDMPAFLSALASTVLSLCSVMNKPNGGRGPDWGWPMEQEITGWLGKTAVAPTLDSAPDTPLSFYHRIMYMGWPCTTQGHGTMPVEEGVKQGVLAGCHQDEGHGAQEAGEQGILAGCHPFRLSDQSLRGVNAALPAEGVSVMAEIMEEAVPPQASVELVQKIANLWLPCRPFETINTEARREPGIRYHRVVCMESPCAPEYLAIIHEARRRLVEEANRINDARPDSDGCRLYSLLEGVEDLLCIDVKDVPMPMMTIVDSIRQAQKNIGWPKAPTVKK